MDGCATGGPYGVARECARARVQDPAGFTDWCRPLADAFSLIGWPAIPLGVLDKVALGAACGGHHRRLGQGQGEVGAFV